MNDFYNAMAWSIAVYDENKSALRGDYNRKHSEALNKSHKEEKKSEVKNRWKEFHKSEKEKNYLVNHKELLEQ